MKTKSIPAFIMLLAGAIACILGILNRYDTTEFVIMLFGVLVIFYFWGCIIKIVIDKNFQGMDKQVQDEQEESEEAKENIESSEEKTDK